MGDNLQVKNIECQRVWSLGSSIEKDIYLMSNGGVVVRCQTNDIGFIERFGNIKGLAIICYEIEVPPDHCLSRQYSLVISILYCRFEVTPEAFLLSLSRENC